MKRLAPVLALLLLPAVSAVPAVSAASPAGNYRFERPVIPAGPGPNRLAVDVPLLAGVAEKGLADLRFFDAAGREVPYLVLPPSRPEPEWRAGRLLPVLAGKTESGFEIELPAPAAGGGASGASGASDRLRLAGLPPPYLKRFRLEGSGDRSHWTLLVAAGTLFDLPEEGLRWTDIDFPAGDYRYLRLTWNDASSARLPLPGRAEVRLARPLAASPATPAPIAGISFERRPSEPGKSRFRLHLPGRRLPVVAIELAIELAVDGGGALLRPATVTEGRLSAASGQIEPQRLGGSTLRRTVRGELAAADLRIPIDPPLGAELELTVEDGDNPPLALTAAAAVLAPLPWIYFEAADASPLTARYGDRSAREATPPRYDLEAVRESLLKAQNAPGTSPQALAVAHWGEAREVAPGEAPPGAIGGVGGAEAPGAAIETSRFRYRRVIPAGTAGPASLTALVLDAEVLARSPGLADLRIADASGHQVPYILERRDEPLEIRLAALERHQEAGDRPGLSRYRIELPYPALPAARLVLLTSARVFERTLRLVANDPQRQRDPREQGEWTVATATWRHADPDGTAPELTLDLPTLPTTHCDLVVEEGDNAPLPLAAPRLLLPAYRLRFFYPVGEAANGLTLLYGQAGLAAPRYDLTLLAPRLLGETAREIALPAATAAAGPAADPEALGRKVFWGALIGAVAVLLVLLGRLLRQPAPPAE